MSNVNGVMVEFPNIKGRVVTILSNGATKQEAHDNACKIARKQYGLPSGFFLMGKVRTPKVGDKG